MTDLIAIAFPQGPELVIILVIFLLLFGGSKIPQLMKGIGKGVGEFQSGLRHGKKMLDEAMDDAAKESDSEDKKELAADTKKD